MEAELVSNRSFRLNATAEAVDSANFSDVAAFDPRLPPWRLGNRTVRFALVCAIVSAALGWIDAPVALGIGAAVGLLAPTPLPKAWHDLAKWLLQASIVLLGFGLDLAVVVRAGESGFALAAVSIAITFILGALLTRWLGVRRGAGRLISAGTAICGGSAIAAVGSATDADDGDMTVAMGVVFLLNAAALYLFPVIGHALGLTQHQFGVWAGVAIQDVSSTVGAAARYGDEALATATAVKLSRALWIVPVVLSFALLGRVKRRWTVGGTAFGFANTTPAPGRLQLPWFIGLFVLASLLRTMLPAVANLGDEVGHLAKVGLTISLLLIGTGMNRRLLTSVGWRAFTLGLILWLVLATGGLLAVLKLG
ncbi:MAG: putative sulfate exporter family transporter [Tepidisphaeraceae bacterium]